MRRKGIEQKRNGKANISVMIAYAMRCQIAFS